MIEAAPIGMSLEGVPTHENLLLIHQGKIDTCQAEETLKAFTLQRNHALFLRLHFRQGDLIIRHLGRQSSSGMVGPRASTLPLFT